LGNNNDFDYYCQDEDDGEFSKEDIINLKNLVDELKKVGFEYLNITA